MDIKSGKVVLYTSQSNNIVSMIENEGCFFVKMEFIKKKYEEVSDVFLTAYNWFNSAASKIVKMPESAESAVWSFLDPKYLDKNLDFSIIKLEVPLENVIFFRMSDWNKVLNYRFIGTTEKEEDEYNKKLESLGINYEGDVYMTPYYPMLKKELVNSFENLFRFDENIKQTGELPYEDMQGAIWEIKKEWVLYNK